MVITILETREKNAVIIKCKNKKFVDKYGAEEIKTKDLLKEMIALSEWINNDLKDVCFFEIG